MESIEHDSDRGSAAPTRRGFLRGAAAAGIGLGLGALGLLPPARRAYAYHENGSDGYQIYTGACPSYAGPHNCSPGCGPSTVHPDACHESGHFVGWHKNVGRVYKLRKNECVRGTGWDGWNWRYSARCGNCGGGVTYRCHDGWRCDACRRRIACYR
jgi:hypothetical protein